MLKSFFNWKVILNLVIAVSLFLGLIFLTLNWLKYHTNHGKEIPVPNVMNMSVYDAIKVLEDSGLKYKVDSGEFQPKYKPLQVLQIWPRPGSRVKNNREIEIRINPKTWAKVSVPNILERYKVLAFKQLERVGLKVGDTIYEPNIQRDAVLQMRMNGNIVKPGDLLDRFSTIDLVIGTGPKRDVPVPNVIGLTVAEAKQIIADNLFEVGLIEFEDGKGDLTDIVYYQDPASMNLRDQGMQIDIWASKKTLPELSAKIMELDAIYKVKIDIDENTEEENEKEDSEKKSPTIAPVAIPKKVSASTSKPNNNSENTKKTPTTTQKVTNKSVEKNIPKPNPNKVENKNSPSATNKPKPSTPPVEKPKKKVVVE